VAQPVKAFFEKDSGGGIEDGAAAGIALRFRPFKP
jgi:hypothetical protein